LTPLDCVLTFKNFDYPLPAVKGNMDIEPGLITIHQLNSTNEQSIINLSGQLRRQQQEQEYHLNLQMQNLELTPSLQAHLPPASKAFCEYLDLRGKMGANLEFNHHSKNDTPGTWGFQGEITLQNGTVIRPLPTEAINGKLQGEAYYNTETGHFQLTGKTFSDSMLIRKRPVKNLTAQIHYNGKEKSLSIADINGTFCNGRVGGDAKASLDQEQAGYSLELLFNNVDLPTFANAENTDPTERKNLTGRCNGWFSLNRTYQPENREGRFLFDIKDAILGELPIAAQLLYVLNLAIPKEGAFNEASISGDIVGEKTRFDAIALRGSAVKLNGTGYMTDPNNHLELVFDVESPHDWPRIPVISSFFNAMQPQIAQVRVSGTFNEPKVEPVAFPSLDDALRNFSDKKSPHPSSKSQPPSPPAR
jgi:hypothetical protein